MSLTLNLHVTFRNAVSPCSTAPSPFLLRVSIIGSNNINTNNKSSNKEKTRWDNTSKTPLCSFFDVDYGTNKNQMTITHNIFNRRNTVFHIKPPVQGGCGVIRTFYFLLQPKSKVQRLSIQRLKTKIRDRSLRTV